MTHSPEPAQAANTTRRSPCHLASRSPPCSPPALLAGCGSSDNGITSKSAPEILQASEKAVGKASSVTITGPDRATALTLTRELMLTRDGGQGTVSLLGIRLRSDPTRRDHLPQR